jgi:ligand-binding SRPBCC domain-containing protein
MSKMRTLESETWLPACIDEIFAFFSDIRNLERLTPAWLRFHVVTPPVAMGVGTLIDYRLKIHGLPVHWRSEITAWEPPHGFVDEQRKGPYKKWVHTHIFEARDGGTLIRDHVEYQVPGFICEPLLHRFMVGPDLKVVFAHRKGVLEQVFPRTADGLSDGDA